jgi:multiple sugar transport system permease protein
LFISPWLIGFLLFTIYPLVSSLYYGFTRYDLLNPPVPLGLGNYIDIFTEDPHFGKVVSNTLYYVGLSAPLGVVAAFLMASLLNTEIAGRSVFRPYSSFRPSCPPS